MIQLNLMLFVSQSALLACSLLGGSAMAQAGNSSQPQAVWVQRGGNVATAPAANSPQTATKGGVPAKSVAIIMFTRWVDPRESAFAVNVPQGWQISGGMNRRSSTDASPVVRAQSADGRIQVLMGDPNILPATVPNQMYAYAGIREGQITRDPAGNMVLMSRYLTGQQYAQSYIYSRLCRQARITRSSLIPDASRQLTAQAMVYGRAQGALAQGWVGDASFQCGTRVGYVRAATVLVGFSGGLQVWAVMELSGFMAAGPEDVVLARYVMNNMTGSLQMNPQWEVQQARLTRDVTGAVLRAQQQMAASIAQHARVEASHNQIDVMSGWEQRNKVRDAALARDSEARRGVTTVGDSNGYSYTVGNEYNYHWRRADGSIMGTTTDTPPDYSSGWELLHK
jgi:hypothetical protein